MDTPPKKDFLSDVLPTRTLLFDENPVPMWVFDSESLRFRIVNASAIRKFGYSRAEFLSMSLRDLYSSEDGEACMDAHTEVGEDETPARACKYLKKSGEILDVEITSRAVIYEGRAAVWMVVQDITRIRQTEKSVQNLEGRIQQISESLPHIIWTADAEGRVDYSNHRFFEYTGLSEENDPATRWQPLLHPEDSDRCMEAWQHSLRTKIPLEIEYRIRGGKDKTYRWFKVQASPVYHQDGSLALWYGTAIDIHESKTLEASATRLAERLSNTLESITDAFYTVDTDWCFTGLNSEAERLLRRTRGELIGRSLWTEFPEVNGTLIGDKYRQAVKENRSESFEVYYEPLETWFEVHAYPSGEGLAVYFRDVTERIESSKRLLESEAHFRELLYEIPQVAIQGYELDGTVVYWNKASETFYGYTEAEALGGNLLELIIPSELRETVSDMLQKVREGHLKGIPAAELNLQRKDGSRIRVFSSHSLSKRPGKNMELYCIDIDLEELKWVTDRMREQALFLDQAKDAILVRDLENRIIYWNQGAEKLYGWASEEVIGKFIHELLYTETSSFEHAFQKVIQSGEWNGELGQIDRNHETLTVECRWTLLRDDEGRPKSVLAINSDITDRKKLENQFMRAQRMESIGTLAGGIAHDLNNVFSPLMMAVDLLKTLYSNPGALEILDTVSLCTKRGAEMVSQVLSFARGMDGKRIDVRLDYVLQDMEKVIRDSFPKNIEVDLDVPDDVWRIEGDPTQLHQVFLNLCVNARDALPDGGCIRILARNRVLDEQYAAMNIEARTGPHVCIEIEDNGFGIPKKILDKIFDPFFTTKAVGKGTGLGLSTSLAIIKSHGGFIRVYSDEGIGTQFRIYLPAKRNVTSTVNTESEALLPRGHGETILVVDDEASIRQITRQTLETFGYRVMLAADGAEAVSVYAQHGGEISMVLTDMMMPVMDGPATIKVLRRLNPNVRIIGASGIMGNGNIARAADAGVKQFLPKPYTAETLLKAVALALSVSDESPKS